MNEALTQMLQALAAQIPGGTSSAFYQDVYNAIVNNPTTLSAFNAAAANGSLTGFQYAPDSSAWFVNNGTIVAGADFISQLNSDGWTSAQQVQNEFDATLGHELWHVENAATIAQEESTQDSQLQSDISQGETDLTSWVQADQNIHLSDEASANIQGWNFTLAAAVAANGGSALSTSQLNSLISNTPAAGFLFDVGASSPTPLSGITMDSSGAIENTNANILAENSVVGLLKPSNAPSTSYYQYYGSSALGTALEYEAAQNGPLDSFTLNYNTLKWNLPPSGVAGGGTLSDESVDNSLISAGLAQGGLYLGLYGEGTVENSYTGGSTTFTQSSFGNDYTYTPYAASSPVPNAVGGPVSPSPISGTIPGGGWETLVDTENPNPDGTFSDVFGTGSTLTESNNYDPITIQSGASATLIGNTNSIHIDSGSSVTVQGNDDYLYPATGVPVTITGTSDVLTLATANAVTLGASSQVTITGNSDTVTGGSGNTITLNGSNNTLTEAGGSTETISGSSDHLTISAASSTASLTGTGETISAASDTVDLGNNSTATITGNSNKLALGTGVAVTLSGTGETVGGSSDYLTLGKANSATITGTSNNVTLGTSDTVTLGSNSSATFTGNSDIIKATGSGDTTTVNGSSNTLTEGASGTETVTGSNDKLTISAASSTATLNGTGETISAKSDTVNLGTNGTATVTGNSNTMALGTGVAVTLSGTGDEVAGNSDYLTLGNSYSLQITGTGNSVTLGTGDVVLLDPTSGSATFTGNGDTITAYSGETVTVNGSSNTLTEGASDTETITGSNNQLTMSSTKSTATLNGTGETISATSNTVNLGTNSTAAITGNTDTLALGTSVACTLNGTGEIASATSDVLTFGASAAGTVTGNGNTISTGNSASVTVKGNSNAVTLGATSTVTLTGTSDDIVAASDTITLGNTSKSIVAGSSNTLNLGTSDQIFVNGSSDTVNVKSGDIVDLASNMAVTIVGSGATIVGNSGDTISVSGTNNNVYADSSAVEINGTNTGDIVHGNADTGNRSNWGGYVALSGAYGGYSGGGYYSSDGDAVRSRRTAARGEQSRQVASTDIAVIGAEDHLASSVDLMGRAGFLHNPSAHITMSPREMGFDVHAADVHHGDIFASAHQMAQQLLHAAASWTSGNDAYHTDPVRAEHLATHLGVSSLTRPRQSELPPTALYSSH